MGSIAITNNSGGATATASVEEGGTAIDTIATTRTVAWVYSIAGGTHASLFSIDSVTGVLTANSGLAAGVYQVIVRATDPDNGATVDQTIPVTANAAAVGGGAQFIGNGCGSALLSNIRMVAGGSNNGSNEAESAVTFTTCQVDTVDRVRQHHIWRDYFPNNYSKGNGGTWRVSIWTYDALTDAPGVKLAETAEFAANPNEITSQSQLDSLYPGAIMPGAPGEIGYQLTKFPTVFLTTTLTGMLGTKVAIVTEPVRGGTSHYTSIDHLRNKHQFIRTSLDPDIDPAVDLRVKMLHGSAWIDKSAHAAYGYVGIFELGNGTDNYGFAYFGTPTSSTADGDPDRVLNVNGTERARQSYDFPVAMNLSKLGLAAGIESGSADLVCDIKQGGSTLASVSFSGFPSVSSSDNVVDLHNSIGWQVENIDVDVGAGTVYFELRTTAGTHYEVPILRDGEGVYFTGGGVPEGVAQYSNNSGSSWATAGDTDIAFAAIGTPL